MVAKRRIVETQSHESVESEIDEKTKKSPKETKKIREVIGPIHVDDVEGEVVEECVHQLLSDSSFIYNTRHEHATVIVENLGYGDVYVSEDPNVRAGTDSHRLLFKEQIAYKTRKLFFSSPSEPVVSIIEVK